MIILGISLLRMGDLILQRPLIEGLRRAHPQSEIHLLINKQFAQVEFLFEGLVDRFIYFDREGLQKSCGEKEYSIFWGVRQLQALVDEINRTSYDVVYNFTHNRLTAHLAGLVTAPKKVGIYSEKGNFHGLTNAWIQFFNSYFGRPEARGFHYTELLARALEVPLAAAPIRWRRPTDKRTILIQPLTSDSKKNWELEKFHSVVQNLKNNTSFDVKILGAPFERDHLAKVFPDEDMLICGLQEAVKALQGAALLITGDTSIKHLGALYDVPILELSLGSSQPLQVGAFSNNAVILQGRVACGPCPHSQKCSQSRHLCGEALPVSAVVEAAELLLQLKRPEWEDLAQKYPELNLFKTEIRHILGWTVQCLSIAQRSQFEEINQSKMMIIEELNRRQESNKGILDEQRARKLSDRGVEAP